MNKKETEEKKAVKSTKKATKSTETTKKSTTTKKATTKNSKKTSTGSNKSTKSTSTKKASSTKKTATKKTTSVKKTTKMNSISVMEYYDLPYRYNQTVVKILAQTPNMLFVYWDIADSDRQSFTDHYGKDFFSKTKPVLIIHNETMNYYFEIEINDFANSWYLHVNDANCKYSIELGRRPLAHISEIREDYIYISSSNKLDAPNDHVLFEKFSPNVYYKNVKNSTVIKKDFSKLLPNDLYKKLYNDNFKELIDGSFVNQSSSSQSF